MEQKLTLKWIKTKTEDYDKMLDLRDKVLRRPLGMVLDREALREDEAGLLTAWIGESCVGAMVLKEEDPETSRML